MLVILVYDLRKIGLPKIINVFSQAFFYKPSCSITFRSATLNGDFSEWCQESTYIFFHEHIY